MTMQNEPQRNRQSQGNQHPPEKSEKSAIGLIILCVVLLIVMLNMWSPSTTPDRPLTDAEKCQGLSGAQCMEALALEKRRRDFVESEEGQTMLRAADAAYGR